MDGPRTLPGKPVAEVELPGDLALGNLMGRPLNDDLPLMDEIGPVRYGQGIPDIVVCQENTVPFIPQAQDDLLYIVDGDGVDSAEGLVEKQEVGHYGEAPGDLHLPALPSAEGIPLEGGDPAQAEIFNKPFDHRRGGLLGRGVFLKHKLEILPNGEITEYGGLLGKIPHAETGTAVDRQGGYVPGIDADRA